MSSSNDDDTRPHKTSKQTLHGLESPMVKTGAHPATPPPPMPGSQRPTEIPNSAPVPKMSMAPGMEVDKGKLARLWEIQNGVLVQVVDGYDTVVAAVADMLRDNRWTRGIFFLVLLAMIGSEWRDEMRHRAKMESDRQVIATIEAGRLNVQDMRDKLATATKAMADFIAVQNAADDLAAEEAETAAAQVPAWRRVSSAEPAPPSLKRRALKRQRLEVQHSVAKARAELAPRGTEKAERLMDAIRAKAKLDAFGGLE